MKVSVQKYIDGVKSIHAEQPSYKLGHDGSDGTCDCIGMVRGGLKRAGATDVIGLSGTNYAARYTIKDLRLIENDLRLGEVVLKTRPENDADMPLPDKYKKGGASYNGNLTNYTHIGTVTSVDPLKITHMTSPTAKIDTKVGNWKYHGRLPYVDYDIKEDPKEEPIEEPQTAIVCASSGGSVKMRQKPSASCRIYWDIPIGEQVIVDSIGTEWSKIRTAYHEGFMMTKFLDFGVKYTLIIPHLGKSQADALVKQYPGAYTEEERG